LRDILKRNNIIMEKFSLQPATIVNFMKMKRKI